MLSVFDGLCRAPFLRPGNGQGDFASVAIAPEGSVCPVDTCPKGKATRRWGVKRAAGMVVPAATIERPVCGAGSSLAVLRFTLLEEQWRRMASVGLQLDYDDSHHRHVSTLATLRLTLLEAQWRRMVSVGLQLDYAGSRHRREQRLGRAVDHLAGGAMEVSGGWRYFAVQ